MRIITNGRNIELTDAIKEYVNHKLEPLAEHFSFVQEVHVFLSVEKNPSIHDNHLAEATVRVSKALLRVEVAKENLYASIDSLADKMDRALRKHKTKIQHQTGHHKAASSIRTEGFDAELAQATKASHEGDTEEGLFWTYEPEDKTETATSST
jgi:putative sigma-54 modulation protein